MGKLHLTCGDYISNSLDMNAIVNAQNKYKENMINGEVRITPGFNLPSDIIHVLAPKYYEESDPINSLMDCYDNLLLSIKEKKYKKVLIPSLGTGVHGYKHEDVVKPLMNLLMGFCKMNDVDIYLNNKLPIQKDIYLKYYLQIKNLDLKNDLKEKSISEIKKYLEENELLENNIISKYNDFVKGIDLPDLCLSQKLLCLQYIIYNFNLDRKQLDVLIDNM